MSNTPELTEEQQDLLKKMSGETVKYFAAIMEAFEIPNYVEASVIIDEHLYFFRIDKKKIDKVSEKLKQCMIGRDAECNHPKCPISDENIKNSIHCQLPLNDYRQ